MSIVAENNGIVRELIPAGNHIARCYSMVQIGTIQEHIMGKDKELHKVRITWEVPGEMRVFNEESGEQPMVVSKEYTLSMNEKATLRKDLESWRGAPFTEEEAKAFDITALLGIPCMLNIIHKTSAGGNQYVAISAVSSIPKEIKESVPAQINDNFEFTLQGDFDQGKFDTLPEFLQDKIKSSKEYKELFSGNVIEAEAEKEEQPVDTSKLPF